MKPILFLDIDGVLWCHDSRYRLWESMGWPSDRHGALQDDYGYVFPQEHTDALSAIVERSGCEIVISSTWRILQPLEELQAMWEDRKLPGKVIDITPRIPQAPRGWEIRAWLNKHRGWGFDAYAIVDDDSDMMYNQRHNFQLIKGIHGLQQSDVHPVCQMLES